MLYKKIILSLGVLGFAATVAGFGEARADAIMPDFADVPTGWVTDRYQPDSFANVGTYEGRDNVLGIGISEAQGQANRGAQSGAFYNTQGMQYAVTGGVGSVLSADLYVSEAWLAEINGTVRTDMWGVMPTDERSDHVYPIIGFTNSGDDARFRVWDEDTTDGWVDLAFDVTGDMWVGLSIEFGIDSFIYSIDDTVVYTDYTTHGTDGFSAVIMQAYNYYGVADTNPIEYTAHWANTASVPEPASLALFGLGLAGIAVIRRRRRAA